MIKKIPRGNVFCNHFPLVIDLENYIFSLYFLNNIVNVVTII